MPPRRKSAAARSATAPTEPAAAGQLTETEMEADRNAAAARSVPPEPVRKIQIERPEPIRAGGYVLTERGWVLDDEQSEE